jgi:hypothetical protein
VNSLCLCACYDSASAEAVAVGSSDGGIVILNGVSLQRIHQLPVRWRSLDRVPAIVCVNTQVCLQVHVLCATKLVFYGEKLVLSGGADRLCTTTSVVPPPRKGISGFPLSRSFAERCVYGMRYRHVKTGFTVRFGCDNRDNRVLPCRSSMNPQRLIGSFSCGACFPALALSQHPR